MIASIILLGIGVGDSVGNVPGLFWNCSLSEAGVENHQIYDITTATNFWRRVIFGETLCKACWLSIMALLFPSDTE